MGRHNTLLFTYQEYCDGVGPSPKGPSQIRHWES